MRPYTISEIQKRVKPVAEKYGLPLVYLFGSYARGEANADSDIDLLVEVRGTNALGWAFGGLSNDLEAALETPIDLITVASLEEPTDWRGKLHFREAVKRERVVLYELA